MSIYQKVPRAEQVRRSSEDVTLEKLETQAPAGIPHLSRPFSLKDAGILGAELLCLALGLLTVFCQPIATRLGQLNQLIAIGFLLGLMALVLQGLVLRTMLIFLGHRGYTTLQSIDAVLRKDMLAPQIHVLYRLILFLLVALPLALSVSYKLFTGGVSSVDPTYPLASPVFGYSATPGNQRIGDGLTLLSDIYRPYWIDPGLNRSYGFNLFIPDNDTALVPDTPYPLYLSALQSSLAPDESLNLTSDVNCTTSFVRNPTESERKSDDYWTSVLDLFGHDVTVNGGDIAGANNGLLAGIGRDWTNNFSVFYFSVWNTTKNETFQSEAIRIENKRVLCNAAWKITSSNTTLLHAKLIQDPTTHGLHAANQSIIENDALSIQDMFSNFLGEYDWHNRAGGFFDLPYPSPNLTDRGAEKLDVNTVPALAASMLWARITSLNAGDRPVRDPDRVIHTMYSKHAADIALVKGIPTLQRSPWLALVLCIHPALALACIAGKLVMWRAPVGEGFNCISLLASSHGASSSSSMPSQPHPSCWNVLRGAGFSGKLDRRVGVRFHVQRDGTSLGTVRLEYTDNSTTRTIDDHAGGKPLLDRGVKYG